MLDFPVVSKKRFADIFKGQGSQEEYSVDNRHLVSVCVRNHVSGRIVEKT